MKYKTYLVQLGTTNGMADTARKNNGDYIDCKHGEIYVTTHDPKLIYDEFADVKTINVIGHGYPLLKDK